MYILVSANFEQAALTEEDFERYKEMGYFNNVEYEMFMYDGVYYLFMSMQDFQRYNQNTQGNS